MSLDNEIANADEEIDVISPVTEANPVALAEFAPPKATAHGFAAVYDAMHSGAAEHLYAARNNLTLKAPKDIDPDMLTELEGMKSEVFENIFKLMHRPEATKEVESNRPWSSDQSVSTLGEQTDDVILAHLAEYVGSNILNSTINIAMIEEAQRSAEELMEVLTLDEDELADRDDLTSAIAMVAKEKAKAAKASRETSERIQEAVKADREEQRREEFQKHWDIDTHEYGGEQLTGAEIMENINWFAKPENQRKVRDSLRAQGKTDKEIEDAIAKTKERDDLLKKLRETPDGLSPEDKKRLEVLNRDSLVLRTSAIVNAGRKQDKDIDVAADSPKNMSAEENKDETIRMRQSMAAKANETSVLVLSKEKDEQLSSSAKAYEHFSSARPLGKDFKAVSVASNSQENELEVTKPKMQMAYAPKLQADAALM